MYKDSKEQPTIDHAKQSVARHWNESGRYTDQTSRADYFNGFGQYDAHLAILPQTIKFAKGNAEDKVPYLFDVGVTFRGSGSGRSPA